MKKPLVIFCYVAVILVFGWWRVSSWVSSSHEEEMRKQEASQRESQIKQKGIRKDSQRKQIIEDIATRHNAVVNWRSIMEKSISSDRRLMNVPQFMTWHPSSVVNENPWWLSPNMTASYFLSCLRWLRARDESPPIAGSWPFIQAYKQCISFSRFHYYSPCSSIPQWSRKRVSFPGHNLFFTLARDIFLTPEEMSSYIAYCEYTHYFKNG